MRFYLKVSIIIILVATGAFSQSINKMDEEAEKYFDKKNYSAAIALWLNILAIDPENQKIQKKIENLYEIKQRKDLSYQISKHNYRVAKVYLDYSKDGPGRYDFPKGKDRAKKAISNFIIAFRLDPTDDDLKKLRPYMKQLEDELLAAEERERLSREQKEKYDSLMLIAKKMMSEKKFELALEKWTEILDFVPNDNVALEGYRKSDFAIKNKIRFQKISGYLIAGNKLFKQKKYKLSRSEFLLVLQLDNENGEAKDQIEEIDTILERKKNYEQNLLRAEELYISGNLNLKKNNYNLAREDFEGVLTLFDSFKDSKKRLESIDSLEQDYLRRQNVNRLKNISKHYQLGVVAISEMRYSDAISSFEKTLALKPGDSLKNGIKKYIDRAKEAQNSLETQKVSSDSPYFEIINSLRISGIRLYKKGKYAKSKNKWDYILNLFPNNKIAHEYNLKCELKINPEKFRSISKELVEQGIEQLKEKKYQDALNKFILIKTVLPKYNGIDKLIARAKRSRKSSSNIGSVNKAEINRRYNIAMQLYKKGDDNNVRKALKHFKWIISKDSGNIRAAINANKIEAQLQGGIAIKRPSSRRLSSKEKRLIRKFYYQGINYYANNKFQKAIDQWRKVIEIDPRHSKAKNNIRKCLVYLRR